MSAFCVLVVAPWYPAGPIAYIAQALERIGCQVERVGPSYNDHMELNWEADIVTPDLELDRQCSMWNLNEFIDWITRNHQAPDLLLCSEENYQADIVPTAKVPSVLWSFDGWPNSFNRYDLYQPTVAYTNHPYGIRIHPRAGEDPRWKFMPAACAPWVHRWLNLARDWDFVLLASMYGKRPKLCEGLVKRELWVWYGQAATKTYVEAHNRAVTTFHNCNGQEEIKFRFFEAMAMGCLVISDHTKLFDRLGYQAMRHYVPMPVHEDAEFGGELWPEVDELYDQIRWLEDHPSIVSSIASTGRVHTLLNHSYYHRCKQIFSDLGITDMVAKADEAISQIGLSS